MSAVTFDTLKLADALEKATVPREQARAIVDVVRESRESTLAEQSNVAKTASAQAVAELDTKTAREIANIHTDMTDIRGDIKLLKWMLGTMIAIGVTCVAGVASLVVKAFF